MLPNFLVIGAQKSATSSLCYQLARHPDIYFSTPKELHFFSYDEIWNRGQTWYESVFADGRSSRAVGEGSTTYTMAATYPNTAPRISGMLPDTKLIYIVRDPMERIESQYMHLRTKGNRESAPFNEAIRQRPSYVDNSRYLCQIDAYRKYYDDDQILVLFFEDFRSKQQEQLHRCYAHLGVDATADIGEAVAPRNVSSQGRVDTVALKLLRRLPFFATVRNRLPEPGRALLRRVIKRPITSRPEWDDATRRWVVDQLADSSQEFLKRYGKPADYWCIE